MASETINGLTVTVTIRSPRPCFGQYAVLRHDSSVILPLYMHVPCGVELKLSIGGCTIRLRRRGATCLHSLRAAAYLN